LRGFFSTLATIWRIGVPYFHSEDRWAGRLLLAALIVIELSVVGVTVLVNQWNNAFYNSLQDRNWDVFVYQLGYFCVLAAAFIALKVYQLYLNQWLQIRWRRWMTDHYLHLWLDGANHYRMQLVGDAADNPDQRIAEDLQLFSIRALRIGLGLLNSVVTIVSFVFILWGLSNDAPLHLFGTTLDIPGYLVWAALIYSVGGTVFAHLIGRPLIRLIFEQQKYEADFRFNLVRARENSEQIALLRGESAESERLLNRFGNVVGNWLAIMSRTKKLTAFSAGFSQAAVVFPYIMVAPAYFAGKVQLGAVMQTASAFGSVQDAMSFFVLTYSELAEWRAVIDRLDGFERAVAAAKTAAAASASPTPSDTGHIDADQLALRLPNGAPLLTTETLEIEPGDKLLVTGPSGSGKSTLFRALAGIWPFASGTIRIPAGAKIMMLPQRPYFPVATLAGAVTYPSEAGAFDNALIAEVITAVGLPHLAGRVSEEAHWNRMLSLGEQQRLAIARALLQKPDFLFLDEATASLDEAAENALYTLLGDLLPETTLVSIGHRASLERFHRRRVKIEKSGDVFQAVSERREN
jgi:putative ATP-binding cassette transporter